MKSNAAFFLCMIFAILLGIGSASRAEWIDNGVPVCTTSAIQQLPFAVSDGVGGAIIVWLDYASGTSDIYAQRVDANGSALWATDGVAICAATGSQYYVDLVPDGAGGAIVAWQDLRIADDADIYAQRIDANGTTLWTDDGVAVCSLAGRQMYPGVVSDGGGGAIVAWHDERGADSDIYAQRLNADGTFAWTANGVPLCAATGNQYYVEAASDGVGGAIVTWTDYRVIGEADTYAQRVDPDGNALWTPDGVALCAAIGDQKWPQIAGDGAGGAVVVWRDYRGDVDGDIYAQRVDPDGATLWTPDGVAVCSEAGVQMTPALIPDGTGGAIIAWYDERIDWQGDIYAQRVNGAGSERWGSTDLAICTAIQKQDAVRIACGGGSGGGGAIITWGDDRWGSPTNFGDDIYAQEVNADGDLLLGADGFPVCLMTGNQMNPSITSSGAGGAIIAWEDSRAETNLDIYAQRIIIEPIAAFLQTFSASISGSAVEIEWSLSSAEEEIAFFVLREEIGTSTFREITGAAIDRDGLSFKFVDAGCEAGKSYRYRVDYVAGSNRSELFETEVVTIPAFRFELLQNHPNPFNPATTIRYTLAERCHVTLEVFDISGRRIACLVNETKPQGPNVAEWNGTDELRNPVSSGVYFYRLASGKETICRKMILLK